MSTQNLPAIVVKVSSLETAVVYFASNLKQHIGKGDIIWPGKTY